MSQLFVKNSLILELTGADVAGFLSCLVRSNIPLYDIQWKDTLSVSVTVPSGYKGRIYKQAEKAGVFIKVLTSFGSRKHMMRYMKRPVLIIGILLIIILSAYLPTKTLSVEVEGNTTVADRYILEAAEKCGIVFGANRKTVRSELVKNKLLELLPQLQWAGVNTYGCRAVISVREKQISEKQMEGHQVTSIIATSDGIIQSVTATKGNLLCSVGQAVKKGQVLISGYLDCGIKIQATRAEGEIFAQTQRALHVVSPLDYTSKDDISVDVKKYSIIFRKNRINLFKDSGIPTLECDKIYKEYQLVLPGGFTLPVILAVEHWKEYNKSSDSSFTDADSIDLTACADEYLSQQMISGKIISKNEEIDEINNTVCLRGSYNCLEMIGRNRAEEILNGEDHR